MHQRRCRTALAQAHHWRIADVSSPEAEAPPGAGSLSEPGTPAALAAQMCLESFNKTSALMSGSSRGSLHNMRRSTAIAVKHSQCLPAPHCIPALWRWWLAINTDRRYMECMAEATGMMQVFAQHRSTDPGRLVACRWAASDDLDAVGTGCIESPSGIMRPPVGSQSADSLQVGSPL